MNTILSNTCCQGVFVQFPIPIVCQLFANCLQCLQCLPISKSAGLLWLSGWGCDRIALRRVAISIFSPLVEANGRMATNLYFQPFYGEDEKYE
ncbi:MAG: hypothetical protein FWH52_00870 [Synergistaceae bacterium]|nr:hypothetical protein [Synergistaceae bacterium]